MILHYFTPWYYLYLVKLHMLFCHESWDTDGGEQVYENRSLIYVSWVYDAMAKEIQDASFWCCIAMVYWFFHVWTPHGVSYFFFERWNICELDDIRFLRRCTALIFPCIYGYFNGLSVTLRRSGFRWRLYGITSYTTNSLCLV